MFNARKTVYVSLIVCLLITLPAIAAEKIGPMTVSAAAIQWQPQVPAEGLTLVVTGPDGLAFTRDFNAGTVVLHLQDLGEKGPVNGSYTYELRATPRVSDEVKRQLRAAHEANDTDAVARIQKEAGIGEPIVQSGSFMILNGAFVSPSVEPPAAGPLLKPKSDAVTLKPASNNVVTNDNEVIVGSLCVGLDCTSGETFGFDTIKLKENNLRIHFDDTSTASGFPNNDWQLTANDSNSGGLNKFSIDDITGGKTPFTTIAGAPTNSLFIASSGKVGFGNNAPGLNLHITATDTPAIRQEQTSGGGFTAQTWDIGANEANWFVRDLTGGSRLPFRIRPGAPTSSLDIQANGNVGIGTASASSNLHVFANATSDTNITLGVANTGPAMNIAYNGASIGRSVGTFNVRADASATAPNPSLRFFTADVFRMIIDNNGNIGLGVTTPSNPIQHSSGAVLTSGGVWQNASSRELKEDICDLSTKEAVDTLRDLDPVRFSYKVSPNEKHVGFIAEDVPELVASRDHKTLSPMDIVAVLTKVVQEQQKTIDQLSARIQDLEQKK